MYAVKSGDIETVRALVECGHLEYGIPNKVSYHAACSDSTL